MPRRIDPYARGQQVYAAVRDLIGEGGIEAVTMRAVAARASLALSSLRHGYRDKDFMMRCVVHECTERIARAALERPRPTGEPVADVVDLLATQIPRNDGEIANGLMWLALVDRARTTDDDTRHAVQELRATWLSHAKAGVQHLGVPQALRALEAGRLALLVEALMAATCDPSTDIDADRAQELLTFHVREIAR